MFLREDTCRQLGFRATPAWDFSVNINGVACIASVSHSHFSNVNVLGTSFFRAAGATLSVDYAASSVRIARGTK